MSSPSHSTSQKCCHRHLYTQQVNRTPTRHRIAPSPNHQPATAFNSNNNRIKSTSNAYPHILDDFHHSSQSLRSSHGNLSKLFRIRKSSTSSCSPSSKSKQSKNTNNMNNAKHLMTITSSSIESPNARKKQCNHNANISPSPPPQMVNQCDEDEIIFTENRIYVATSGRNGTHKKYHSNSITLDRISKSSENRENVANQSTASSPKSLEKEIIFDKMKSTKIERKMLPLSPLATHSHPHNNCKNQFRHPNKNIFETSTDIPSCGSSPSNYRYSEYDNLNESFYRTHNCDSNESGKMHNPNAYIESWDFVNNQNDEDFSNVTMSPYDSNKKNPRICEINYEAAMPSRRSSISTAETWIDDETFDNSFNEELEKRCATYQ